ncbi:MAG: cyclophilin family peptidyl-prolyl cis-trans isomerase [Glaciecola sp.]|jgi:cyclophilin family peptidyl-prolyl cis-trans isomerase
MKLIKSSIAIFSLALMLSATSCNDNGRYSDLGDGIYAEIVTNNDTMVAKLFYDKVPLTVSNFIALAEGTHPMVNEKFKGKKFYNGLTFHRIMNNFMIQGGDPEGSGMGGPGYKFGSEFDITLKHDKPGILSMANSGGLNTNGSQFFITDAPTPWLDGYDANGDLKDCTQPKVGCHSVFGEIVVGLDAADTISNLPVGQGNKPNEDVIIKEINIIRVGYEARKFDAAKTWETELPLLEEKRVKAEEDAKKEAEDAQKASEAMFNEAAAELLLTLNDYKSKTTTSDTGLMTYVITKGTGEKVKQGDNVMVWYEGYFADGKLFDSNRKDVEEKFGKLNPQKAERGMYSPMPMLVSPDAQIVAGFKEGVANLSVGEKIYIYLPSHLAYGEAGRGNIQPNTDLSFIIEMVEITQ